MSDIPRARLGTAPGRGLAVLAAVVLGVGAAACGSSATQTRTITNGGTGSASGSVTASSTSVTATGPVSSTAPTATTPTSPPPSGRHHPLSVSPASAAPDATLRFSFVAASAGTGNMLTPTSTTGTSTRKGIDHGGVSYTLSVSGPVRSGCVGVHGMLVPGAGDGGPVSVAVGPSQLGGRWCTGDYTARVEELLRPVCPPGAMCPDFIRLVAVFGPARFRITAG